MVRAAAHLYKTFGLPGAGLIFMLEGIGVPIPVEIPLGIVGIRMAQGLNTYWEIVVLMWLSTVVGNTTGYFLGYFGGRPLALKLLTWVRVRPETWQRLEEWFRRHGLKVVVATRWINWGFAQNMWLCGITRMPFARFFAVMVLNDLLWAMAWTWVSLQAVRALQRASHVFRFLHDSALRVGVAALLVIAIGLGTWYVIKLYRRGRVAEQKRE